MLIILINQKLKQILILILMYTKVILNIQLVLYAAKQLIQNKMLMDVDTTAKKTGYLLGLRYLTM